MTKKALETFRRFAPLRRDLARDIHPDRWAALGIDAGAAARLIACDRSRRSLSRGLAWVGLEREGNGDESFPVTAMPEHADRALLSGGELWRRALCFGSGCFRAEVSGLVLRRDVAAFREAVGEEAHLFALRRAPLLWREGSAALEGLPERGTGDIAARVRKAAGLGLGCWVAALPGVIGRRALLKLPPEWCDGAAQEAEAWPEARREAWVKMMARVFSLFDSL